jgi:hypothetical protein
MVIHHPDLSRVTAMPSKYETPLIIDADRIKTSPLALERFKSITGRDTQITQLRCVMQGLFNESDDDDHGDSQWADVAQCEQQEPP